MKIPVAVKQVSFIQGDGDFTIYSGTLTLPMYDIVNYVLRELVERENENSFEDFCGEKAMAKKLKERFAKFKEKFNDMDIVIKPTSPEVGVHNITSRLWKNIKPKIQEVQKELRHHGAVTDFILNEFFQAGEALSDEGNAPFVAIEVKRKEQPVKEQVIEQPIMQEYIQQERIHQEYIPQVQQEVTEGASKGWKNIKKNLS